MKGTILNFLKLAAEKPELAKELGELASKYDFRFTHEVSDEELESVAGGMDINACVKVLLTEGYLDNQSLLADKAAQLQSFNEKKETVREHVDGLRNANG